MERGGCAGWLGDVAVVLIVLIGLDIVGVDDFGLRLVLAAAAGVVAGSIQLLFARRRDDWEPGDPEKFQIERAEADEGSSWDDVGVLPGCGSDPVVDVVKSLKRLGLYRVTSRSAASPEFFRAIEGGFVRRCDPPAD